MAGLFKKVFMPKETTPLDAQGRLVPSYANYLGAIEPMSAALSAFDPDTFEADILAAVTTATAFLSNRTYAEYTTAAAGSTNLPMDNTIPQITEGDEILSVTLTPTSATARLRVQFDGTFSMVGAAASGGCALFINGGTSAVAAMGASNPGTTAFAGAASYYGLVHEYVPGTITVQTISIRVGAAASIAFRTNSFGTAGQFSTAGKSTLVASQITA